MSGEPWLVERRGALWVFAKPAGYAVHRASEGVPDLLRWAVEALGAPSDLAPVHRIDRETSGLVLCADEAKVRGELGRHFAEGRVEKRYRCLVHGRTNAKGIVRRPIVDRGKRQPAVTRYRRLERLGGFSLLEVRPESGRRHQIRQHLQGIGHAIVGDRRYRPKRFRPVPGFPERLWLHAAELALPEGERYECPLPPELDAHLALLRNGAPGEDSSHVER